jgi:tRNA pseudouridine55 synthase
LADSINLEALMANSEGLISPRIALAHLDWISFTPERVIDWFHGRKINLTDTNVILGSLVAVESLEAEFLGIGEIVVIEDEYYLQPKIVIQQ